jgi:hypothetical protein
MRKLALIVIALAAAGAADARPRHRTIHPRAAAATAAPPSRPDAAAGPEAADREPPGPAQAFGGLAALNEAQARVRLGPPDIARGEGAGAMWTYRLPDCALFVFFRSAAGQPLRVSGASAGPRRRGQTPPSVEACIAQARAGKS